MFNFQKSFNYWNKFLAKIAGKKYFGINNLDLQLSKILNYRDGFFVELGAHDGETQSNTKFFELFKNWKGILIEPNPESFAKLLKNRNALCYNFAIVGNDFRKDQVHLIDLGPKSVIPELTKPDFSVPGHLKGAEKMD